MQDWTDNIVSISGGMIASLYGMTKGLAILPSAGESINTLIMAGIGGAGGFLAKEGLRVLFKAIKNKRDARKQE